MLDINPPLTDQDDKVPADLTGRVTKTRDESVAVGGLAQIYDGELKDPDGNVLRRVAIKVFTGAHIDEEQKKIMTRRLNREAKVWVALKHRNVLDFLGISKDVAPSPGIITPFCKNGNVNDYLKSHPNVVRIQIIRGAADGLAYLHSKDVLHGDVKCENIVIDDEGDPRWCDFGRSRIVGRRGFTTVFAGLLPYLAPELIASLNDDQPVGIFTKSTDVYGFSMFMLEYLTGKKPYFYIGEFKIISLLEKGIVPDRARYVEEGRPASDKAWEIMKGAWAHNVSKRWTIDKVVEELAKC